SAHATRHDLRLDYDVAQRAALDAGQDSQLGSAGAYADLQDAIGLGDGELACPGQPLRKQLTNRDSAPAGLDHHELDDIALHFGTRANLATAVPSATRAVGPGQQSHSALSPMSDGGPDG